MTSGVETRRLGTGETGQDLAEEGDGAQVSQGYQDDNEEEDKQAMYLREEIGPSKRPEISTITKSVTVNENSLLSVL